GNRPGSFPRGVDQPQTVTLALFPFCTSGRSLKAVEGGAYVITIPVLQDDICEFVLLGVGEFHITDGVFNPFDIVADPFIPLTADAYGPLHRFARSDCFVPAFAGIRQVASKNCGSA